MALSPVSSRGGLPSQWSAAADGKVVARTDPGDKTPIQIQAVANQAPADYVLMFEILATDAGRVLSTDSMGITTLGTRAINEVPLIVRPLGGTTLVPAAIFGNGVNGARLRLEGIFAASPSDPIAGSADLMIVDLGATQFLRVRYNDGGVIRVGDLALV